MDRRLGGLALGVVATAAVLFAPLPGLSPAGQAALATMAFAGVLWVTEALPLPVTSLAIPVVLTVLGAVPRFAAAVAGFADPIVFLLLAGFALGAAFRAHDLDRRIALHLLHRLGTSPARLVLAVMVATAGLSMLVSNSATAAMMAPIALGVARQASGREGSNLETATLLGVAYAASVGGVGTLIGTPPNAIVVAQLADAGVEITFLEWLALGLPLVALTLPVVWLVLLRLYPPGTVDVSDARAGARADLAAAGPLSPAARRTLLVTGATATLWVVGGLGSLLGPRIPAAWTEFLYGAPDREGILYFVLVGVAAIPTLVATRAVAWEDLADIDWGTLVLLGGGLALADALAATDAVRWLADVTVGRLVGAPVVAVIFAIVVVTILLGELASNTAMVAIFAPLLITVGPRYAGALGVDGLTAAAFLAVASAMAASFGFALPVATPPNAIVYGTGTVSRAQMLRAGARLDVLLALALTAVFATVLALGLPVLAG